MTPNRALRASILSATLAWLAPAAGAPADPPTLLYVTDNAASLNSEDTAHIARFESWGYSVTTISDHAATLDFDTAIAGARVMFIGENVASADVGTRATNAGIGIVTEETQLQDELLITNKSATTSSTTTFDVSNNTHYITSAFSTGALTVLSAANNMASVNMTATVASGAQTLGMSSDFGNKALVIVDAGALLVGGGAAPGRRVLLPWGTSGGGNFAFTADGIELMRRSVHWAAGYEATDGPPEERVVRITQWRETAPIN